MGRKEVEEEESVCFSFNQLGLGGRGGEASSSLRNELGKKGREGEKSSELKTSFYKISGHATRNIQPKSVE